jgi:hypothetical protein
MGKNSVGTSTSVGDGIELVDAAYPRCRRPNLVHSRGRGWPDSCRRQARFRRHAP